MAEKVYTWAEIRTHNKPNDLWCVIHGKVYDLTQYQDEHPGGSYVLEVMAGKDATVEFIEAEHSKEAEREMEAYKIGILAPSEITAAADTKLIITLLGAVLAGIATAFILKRLMRHL